MKVKIVNHSRFALPEYQTPLSAGLDIRANLDESITLNPLERALVPTGLFVELPEGHEMQIRPRSGLAAKHGIVKGKISTSYIVQRSRACKVSTCEKKRSAVFNVIFNFFNHFTTCHVLHRRNNQIIF